MLEKNIREYYLMIISGTLTMLSGGFVSPIFAPYLRMEFSAPLELVGFAVSGYFLLRMLGEFPIGVLSDRVGPKYPIVVGRILAVAGALICYWTSNIWFLIFARIIWGLGDASFFCIGMTYVSKLFTSERRGRALGVFQAVELIGSFLGQTIGGYVAGLYGPRTNFLGTTIMAGIALLVVTLIRGDGSTIVTKARSAMLPSIPELRKVLNRTVVVACVINLVCMINNNGLQSTILPIYVTETLGLNLTLYAFLVSASTVGSVSGNLIGGTLSDKYGRKKVLLGGLFTGIIALAGITIFKGFYPLLVMMFFNGVFWGIVYGVIPAYIADSVPDEVRGIGIGSFRTFMDMGGLIGPIVMSTFAEYIGGSTGYIYSFYMGIVMVLGLVALTLTLKDTWIKKMIR